MATISVSMIVKNEESCLATALESVKGADEIIICDTGSTDNTIEIARKYTDKIYTDYTWNDNFAEARNHAASKCTCDYILIIDADEVLESGAMEAFKKFEGEALSMKTVCAKTGQIHASIRLHRNTSEIKWVGAIHNYLDVQPSHVTGWKVYYHYSKSHYKDPNRTLRILRKVVKENPKAARERYYLAVEWLNKNKPEKALTEFLRYIKISDNVSEKVDALIHIARLYWLKGEKELSRKYCFQAIELNPDCKEALDLMSRITDNVQRLKWQRFADISENNNVLFHRDTKRLRVTMLAEEDFCGSGYNIVKQIRLFDPLIDIEQIVLQYPTLGHISGATVEDIGANTVQHRISSSDIIHFKGDFAYNGNFANFKLPEKAKRIYSVGGSFFRRHGNELISHPKHELSEYHADLLTALTPDLVYNEDWHFVPHAWNTFAYSWKRDNIFRIMHIPSDPEKKNTRLVNDAVNIVLKKRKDVSYLAINNLTPADSIRQKREAHLYLDQFLCDAYGNSAIEAMGFGVPIVTWAGDYYHDNVIQSPAMLTPEALAATILNLLDWDKLEQLSLKTFEYVQKMHGSVGKFWINKYKELTK